MEKVKKEELNKNTNSKPKVIKHDIDKDKLKSIIDKDFEIVENYRRKISRAYVICGLILVVLIGILIALFVARVFIIWIILYIIFASIVFFFCIAILIIRLIMDKDRIQNAITHKLNKHCLKITIFKPNRKKVSFYVNIIKDYFIYDGGEYFINEKCIWMDDENIPNSHYFYGIPNPLMLNFRSNIEKYMKYFTDKTKGLNPEKVYSDGYEIELGYNSENVKLLRQDNFINQLHGASNIGIKDILFYVFLFIIIVLQIIVLLKNPVAVTTVADTTKTETAKSILYIIALMRFNNDRK